MKKTALILSILSLLFMQPLSLKAGSGKFDGVITYNITIQNSTLTAEQLAMFPKKMVVSIKGAKVRNESSSSMGTMVEITDSDKKTSVSLLAIMGKKLAIKKTSEEIKSELSGESKPTVQLVNETKTIAGYTCKKAIVTIEKNGKKSSFEIWYSSELGGRESNFGNPVYQDIDGMLMEFTLNESGFTMNYSAASVEKKSVDDTLFAIPSDYTLTTQQELKQMFGGGGM